MFIDLNCFAKQINVVLNIIHVNFIKSGADFLHRWSCIS